MTSNSQAKLQISVRLSFKPIEWWTEMATATENSTSTAIEKSLKLEGCLSMEEAIQKSLHTDLEAEMRFVTCKNFADIFVFHHLVLLTKPRSESNTFSDNKYHRPDPSDLAYRRGMIPAVFAIETSDIFDQSMYFDAQRERLRQNFEWDLERLHLAEEAEKQRREKAFNAAAERRRVVASGKAAEAVFGHRNRNLFNRAEVEHRHATAQITDPEVLTQESRQQGHLRVLDWHVFRSAPLVAHDGVCAIEILAGDPVITNTQDSWYDSPLGRVPKAPEPAKQGFRDVLEPGKRPVPERIRIYPPLLQRILSELLGKPVTAGENSEFVFLRPFKALVYREDAL